MRPLRGTMLAWEELSTRKHSYIIHLGGDFWIRSDGTIERYSSAFTEAVLKQHLLGARYRVEVVVDLDPWKR